MIQQTALSLFQEKRGTTKASKRYASEPSMAHDKNGINYVLNYNDYQSSSQLQDSTNLKVEKN